MIYGLMTVAVSEGQETEMEDVDVDFHRDYQGRTGLERSSSE